MTKNILDPNTSRFEVDGTGPYALDRPYESVDDFIVYLVDGSTVSELDTDDWSVAPAGPANNGDLTLSSGAATTHDGKQIVIERRTVLEQGWEAQNARESGFEAQLDKTMMGVQENRRSLGGALRLMDGDVAPPFEPLSGARAVLWNTDTGAFVSGPTADEIPQAQQHAEDARDYANLAEIAAEQAALYEGHWLDDTAGIAADTSLTYTLNQPGTVQVGHYVRTRNEGFAFRVLVAGTSYGADGYHIATAGGVLLEALPDLSGSYSIDAFGAAGDGSTDDTSALQTAIDKIKEAGGVLKGGGPSKEYRYTQKIDLTLPLGSQIRFVIDMQQAILQQDFNGRNDAGFSFAAVGARSGGYLRCLYNVRFKNGASVTSPPIMLDTSGCGNLQLDNIHFMGSDNTHWKAHTQVNSRFSRVSSWYGGKHFPYKDTTGITFSTTSGSATITASAAHFASGDVGKQITLERSDGRAEQFVIDAYTNSTTVTATENAQATTSGCTGNWEGARIAVTGSTATIDGEDWPSDIVGQAIYIAGADANGNPQRRVVETRTSDTVVELSEAVDTNVGDALFGVPAMDFGSDAEFQAGSSVETNFSTASELYIENYRGIGLLVHDAVTFAMHLTKIHGEAQPDGNTAASMSHIWATRWQGEYNGSLEADHVGRSKVAVFGQQGLLHFSGLTRAQLGIAHKLIGLYNSQTGGVVNFDAVELIGSFNAMSTLSDNLAEQGSGVQIGLIAQSGQDPITDGRSSNGYYSLNSDTNFPYVLSPEFPRVIHDNSTLTAVRELRLSAQGNQSKGDTIRLVGNQSGGFVRRVRDVDNNNIKEVANGAWADFTWDGSDWFVSAAGSL